MISGWIIVSSLGAILALIAGGTRQYLAYRHGRKVQEGVYKDAELKKGDFEKKALEMLGEPNAPNDDELISRLRGKRRR